MWVVLLVVISHVEYCSAGKSLLDFNDVDVERLYQEWEVISMYYLIRTDP